MSSNRRFLMALSLAAALLPFSLSCNSKPSDPNAPPTVNGKPVMPLAEAVLLDSSMQPDVKMLARSQGSLVSVEVQNMTDKPIRVGPENFGVLLKGEGKRIHPFDPQAHESRFPVVGLERGQIATGAIFFKGLGDLDGQRLVFNHMYVRKSVAPIQGEGKTQPAATPPPSAAAVLQQAKQQAANQAKAVPTQTPMAAGPSVPRVATPPAFATPSAAPLTTPAPRPMPSPYPD